VSLFVKTAETYWVKIYMSGPIDVAKQVCRIECLADGLCVTIGPTLFVYTGGEETGFVVGLINYPRFPASSADVWGRARKLAESLLQATAQFSALIMDPNHTEWITLREVK
jgi:hypothetical protein